MVQVSSRTVRPALCRRLLSAGLGALLTIGLTLGPTAGAVADDLHHHHDNVRKALVESRKRVSAGKQELASATARLAASTSKLDQAKWRLAAVSRQLESARATDRAAGLRLADAEQRLKVARRAVTVGQAAIASQQQVLGAAVRSAYQQQVGLVGYSVALGAQTPAEVAQRLQWSTTIFDTSTAELDRLRALQARLVTAKQAQAALEAQVSAQKADAERRVATTRSLQAAAAAAKVDVARLVAQDARDRKQAEADLAADQKAYRKLQAEDARISAEIKRRARLAALAARKHHVSTTTSTKGFIYPVHATPGSPFGMRFHPILHVWRMHRGQDFGAPCGAPLYAVADGQVASARRQGGFGNYTVIDVGFIAGKFVSVGYAHQSRMIVHAGQRVTQGQVIGYVGTTGLSTGCHLHFQVYVNGGVVNPMTYL